MGPPTQIQGHLNLPKTLEYKTIWVFDKAFHILHELSDIAFFDGQFILYPLGELYLLI